MGPVGMTVFVVTLPSAEGPKIVYGATNKTDCLSFLNGLFFEGMTPEEKDKHIQSVPIMGLLFRAADNYASLQHTWSDIVWMFDQAGFGKPGQPNTFWAMTKAAIDELLELRERVKTFEPARKAALALADSNHRLHEQVAELERKLYGASEVDKKLAELEAKTNGR